MAVSGKATGNATFTVRPTQQHTVRSRSRSRSCIGLRPLVLAFVPSPSPFTACHHPCSLYHPADSTFPPSPRPRDQSNQPYPDTPVLARQKNGNRKPRRRRVCSVTGSQAASPTPTACKHPMPRLPPTPAHHFKTSAPAKTRSPAKQKSFAESFRFAMLWQLLRLALLGLGLPLVHHKSLIFIVASPVSTAARPSVARSVLREN